MSLSGRDVRPAAETGGRDRRDDARLAGDRHRRDLGRPAVTYAW